MVRIGTLIDIFNWLISTGEDSAGNSPPKSRNRKPRQEIDDLTYQVMGMRIRAYAAQAFASHHGLRSPSQQLKQTLHEQSEKLATLNLPNKGLRGRLLAGLEHARSQPADDENEISEVWVIVIENLDALDRDWIKEILLDVMHLAKVHGTTAACLKVIRIMAKALRCSIRKKRQPRGNTVKKTKFADHLGYYALLQLERDAEATSIKIAYRRRALELHPDKRKDRESTRLFQELKQAYDVLSNPARRSAYHRGDNVP
jgi:hypothetical protein